MAASHAAQDKKPQLAELLKKLPAQNAAAAAQIGAELVKLGSTGWKQLCEMLVEPGAGDDTKAQFALEGLTFYVAGPGQETARKEYAETLAAALKEAKGWGVKAFLTRQCQLIGEATDASEESSSGAAHMESPAVALLHQARQLAQSGDAAARQEALRILREIWAQQTPAGEIHLRCAALYGLAEISGADTVSDILSALHDENPQLRAAAVQIAARLPGDEPTRTLMQALQKALENAAGVAPAEQKKEAAYRIALIEILTRRGQGAASIIIGGALQDPDPAVRLAAIPAVAELGGAGAATLLIAALKTEQAAERQALQQALADIPNENVSRLLAMALEGDQLGNRVRSAVLEVVARRRAFVAWPQVFVCATRTNEKELRVAAIRTLGALADEEKISDSLKILIDLLLRMEADEERQAAEEAVAVACNQAADKAKSAALVLAALDSQKGKPAAYGALLGVLGRLGGAPALERVRAALQDERAAVREAAIRALTNWSDISAADDLLKIARETQDLKQHVLALRGYARLIGLGGDRPAEEKLKWCEAGLQTARRVDEKKLFFPNLGKSGHPQALKLLEPYLADEALRAEAATALVGTAEGLPPKYANEARAALEKAAEAAKTEALRERIATAMKRLEQYEDYITDWFFSGPYTQKGKKGNEIFEVAFPPENFKDQDIKWTRYAPPANVEDARVIDFNATPLRGDNRAGYLWTRIWSPMKQEARLGCGSDDGIKVWLNQQVVHSNNALRGGVLGDDQIKVTLNEGWNDLLLKVTNNGGGWNANARLRAPDGGKLKGVRVQADGK